jgi:S-adenosylmethionine:tRNA ribosyltransferase-isomerase
LYFGDDDSLVAEVIDNTTSRGRTLRFLYDGSYEEFRKKLTELGETPILNISRDVTQKMQALSNYICKEEGLLQHLQDCTSLNIY